MIDKQTQDLVWSLLPKKFKEEVKRDYQYALKKSGTSDLQRGAADTSEYFFGEHNLTSDADGEEMLTAPSNRVRVYKENIDRYLPKAFSDYEKGFWMGQRAAIRDLFGSKCLPDNVDSSEEKKTDCERCGVPNSSICAHMNCQDYISQSEPKPAEPKLRFKKHDTVRVKKDCESYNELIEIMAVDESDKSSTYLGDDGGWYSESDLEPYIEPKKEEKEGNTGGKLENPQSDQIANCDNQFDNILKDSFSKERRLNIAAIITAGIYSNDKAASQFNSIEALIGKALDITDTLIAECEK